MAKPTPFRPMPAQAQGVPQRPTGPLSRPALPAQGSGLAPARFAEGGPVLGRTRSFMKEPDVFRSAGEDESYGKSGPNAGKPNPKARNKQAGHGKNCGCAKCS